MSLGTSGRCICHLPGSAKYKSLCNSYPYCFEARQPCTKGLPKSSTIGPCWVPCHSTFNKCVWVVLPFALLYTRAFPGTHFPLTYIQYTKLHRHALVLRVQEARASAFWWGKWGPPIRNSILQYWEATEVTVKIIHQLMLTGEAYQVCEYCPQPLHIDRYCFPIMVGTIHSHM